MTLSDLLFNEDIDQTSLIDECAPKSTSFVKIGGTSPNLEDISHNTGLCGSNISSINRVGDLNNGFSLGSTSSYIARSLFKEDIPYYKSYDIDGNLVIIPTRHFLLELRRQLSGEIAISRFSPEEETFYMDYNEWIDGAEKVGEYLLALQALDQWITDEVMGVSHPQLDREYTATHKWYKMLNRA